MCCDPFNVLCFTTQNVQLRLVVNTNYKFSHDGAFCNNVLCTFSKYFCQMSLVMRKPDFCICENRDADQLRSNHEADQRLCFRYTDSTLTLFFKSETLSL